MPNAQCQVPPPQIVVVGAGPAGLMAAIAAGEGGAAVTVCEQLDRAGAKLLATGGGRCNLTNTLDAAAMMARFGRQGRFMAPALAAMDAAGLREFLTPLGVPTVVEPSGQVYPASHSAASVRAALLRRCEQLGVIFRVGCKVTALTAAAGRVTGVAREREFLPADRVILAAGGRSYPSLGGTGAGYELARSAGHEIVPPTPALVPLVTRETWPARCAGVSVPGARVWIDLPRQAKAGVVGDVLLTHRGVSGPAVLDASGDVAGLLARRADVPLRIELTPGVSWPREIERWRRAAGGKGVRALLAEHLPASLAEVLCELAGVAGETRAGELPAEGQRALVGVLSGVPLTIVDTEGFDRAMVTRGGVALKGVNPNTLESRLVSGLFFAGEVLDLDGPCGGFNLQWAFSSGLLAGTSAASSETA